MRGRAGRKRSHLTMAKLSDAQLAQIAEKIFVMGDPATRALPKPTTTGPGPTAFKSALNPIGTGADFADAGIGVIDFTRSTLSPDVWLHNEDKAYRIGSASKIAMMLAAVQLRLEVRRILDLSIISTANEFDQLFRNPKLWKKAKTKPPERWIREIADPSGAPLISKIFDFTKSPVDFIGPDPDSRIKADGTPDLVEQQAIVDKLPASTGEVSWAKWTDFTFSELLWLAGCISDNVAATACVSEIGTPYIRAVQRCYGLADTAHGMHLFASHGYDPIPPPKKPSDPGPQPPRRLQTPEPIHVEDFWRAPSGAFTGQMSWVPGSAAALTAYMVALMTDKFAGPGADPVAGLVTCRTIRNNLADAGPNAIISFLVDGVESVPNTTVSRQINKIGILKVRDGARSPLICEFVYVETKQVPAPPPPRRGVMKYGVVVVGLIDDTSAAGHTAAEKSVALGKAVHEALLTL
jgi:hypothetical protein